MPPHKPVEGHHVKQSQFGNKCFGCGPENETGLKLEFVLDEERQRFVCHFRLAARFVGPPAHAHGGIIATILDEAMGKVNRLHNLVALTSTMDVTYVKPVPLFKPLMVEGWEERVLGRLHYRIAEIRNLEGEVLAGSKGKFVEIDPERMFGDYLKENLSDAT
jgi:acyl-coenzyme A thioesterase PaaI-like protein